MAGSGSAETYGRRKKAELLAAFSLSLVSGTEQASAQDDIAAEAHGCAAPSEERIDADGRAPRAVRRIEKHTAGTSIGVHLTDNRKEFWNSSVTVDVSGSGGGSQHKNVTGIYLLDGGQLTIAGDLHLRLANHAPATQGATPGADVAHYYMSGVYAGYGGLTRDGNNADTKFTLHGDLSMDVVGVGLQANKDGFITVGGGTILTHEIGTDTYALLAEEGSVFMNTGADGSVPGTRAVHIRGNLGILCKNYGIDPNPDRHGSFLSLALPTADSVLTGALLNEYEESGTNRHDAGIDLFLSNGAQWNNRWLGAPRERTVLERPNADSYLYRGSKLRRLFGGASPEEQGNIFQQEEAPITVNRCNGHTRLIYARRPDGSIIGGDFIVKHAAPGSCITLRTDGTGLDPLSADPAEAAKIGETLRALAGKLRCPGHGADERSLRGWVEIAAALSASAAVLLRAEIRFSADGRGTLAGAAKRT